MTSLIYVAIVTSWYVNDVVWDALQCDVIFKLTLSDEGVGAGSSMVPKIIWWVVTAVYFLKEGGGGGGQANYDPPYNGSMSFPFDRLFWRICLQVSNEIMLHVFIIAMINVDIPDSMHVSAP